MGVSKTVAVLLVVACALAGCSAVVEHVGSFSLSTVNCQSLGVVSVTDRYFLNKGTVCGTVTNATANSICDKLGYGTAVRFGTAKELGVSGGTGNIEGTNLVCDSFYGDCTFSTRTASAGCTHSKDLVLQCSDQPSVCLEFPTGIVAGVAVAVLFFCVILPICACIGCIAACFKFGWVCFRHHHHEPQHYGHLCE